MTGSADEIAAGQGRWRASHADREQVVGALQAAFVQGRLTAGELDERVGQALAARTHAELAALTTDLPADPAPAPQPAPAPPPAPARRPQNPAARRAVKAGAGAIGVTVIAVGAAIAVAGEPAAAVFVAVFMLVLAAVTAAAVASLIHVALKLESRQRSRGQHPPGPESGAHGHSAQHVQAPGADPVRPPRRPHGLLATGPAG